MSEIVPLGRWVDQSVHYLLDHNANTFDAIGKTIESFAALIEHGLQAIPMWALMAFFIVIGLWRVGWRFAIFATLSLLLWCAVATRTVPNLAVKVLHWHFTLKTGLRRED